MIPTLAPPGPAPASSPAPTAQKTALPQTDSARSSAGENAAANIRAETTRAIDAPQQSAVAGRLRDQDTKDRPDTVFDELVGPEPTFEESPLERQARIALEPQEIAPPSAETDLPKEEIAAIEGKDQLPVEVKEAPVFEDPPPTPTERAEVSFAETRTLSTKAEPATIDVAR